MAFVFDISGLVSSISFGIGFPVYNFVVDELGIGFILFDNSFIVSIQIQNANIQRLVKKKYPTEYPTE